MLKVWVKAANRDIESITKRVDSVETQVVNTQLALCDVYEQVLNVSSSGSTQEEG